VHVAFVLVLSFMLFPMAARLRNRLNWADVVLAALSIAVIVYMLVGGDDFTDRATSPTFWDQACGVALMLLVLEAARRTSGWIMPVVVIVFIGYAIPPFAFGMVLKMLFAGTVAENIARLGDVDDARVVEAARLACAHDMILRLPQGYDTPIGEAGTTLSGGQRQRIALARALYGAPRLVVLDEPNANLDAEGEAALAEALQELKARGSTVVVVSHRPALMSQLDKLAVLRDGVLEAFGPASNVGTRLRPVARPAPAHEASVSPVLQSTL